MLEAVSDRPAFGWLSGLELKAIRGRVADVEVKPGQMQIATFAAAPARQEQIASLLSNAVGKPITIRLDTTAASKPAPASDPQQNNNAAAPPPGYHDSVALEEARKLPLVDQMLRTFPDASLISAYREQPRKDETNDETRDD